MDPHSENVFIKDDPPKRQQRRFIKRAKAPVLETPVGPIRLPKGQIDRVLDSVHLPKAGTFRLELDGRITKSYVGGLTTVVPMAHHKKYWYFLRKRGYYRFSEHHPYGDEYKILCKKY
jgi:hypothetical protein